MRRCHPRDVISHAIDLMNFGRLPYQLDDDVLDRAWESCFAENPEMERQRIRPHLECPKSRGRTPIRPHGVFSKLSMIVG